MRKLIVISVLCLLTTFTAAMAPFGSLSGAAAAGTGISRGGAEGGDGGGSALQASHKAGTLLGGVVKSLLFVGTAILVGMAALRRDTGAVAVILLLSLTIGAFALAPDQVESLFQSIYRYVL